MRQRGIICGVACLIATVWAVNSLTFGAEKLSGAKVYSQNCGRCHNPPAPGELTARQWQVVMHHMQARAYLTQEEVTALLEFFTTHAHKRISAIQQPQEQAVAALPSSVERGATIVADKGCQGCHAIKGQGGKLGPPLKGVLQRRDKAWLVQQMMDPKRNNPTSTMPSYNFSQAEIESLLLYFQTLQ